jgi:glucose 1-dehydrogenase
MNRLIGKTAIVTGGTRGIGRGIAIAFGREGANVVISGTNAALCEEVACIIRSEGGSAIGIPCDLSEFDQIQALFDKSLELFGEINIMVNNGAMITFESFIDIKPESVRKMLDVNLLGTFYCGQRAAKEMIRQGKGGKIINLSSIMEKVGTVHLTHYGASKGGVMMLTKCMAIELAEHKIHVNAIGPGVIDTDQHAANFAKPGAKEAAISRIPLGRTGDPADIANTALFLATDESDFMTGTTIFVDGGQTSQM